MVEIFAKKYSRKYTIALGLDRVGPKEHAQQRQLNEDKYMRSSGIILLLKPCRGSGEQPMKNINPRVSAVTIKLCLFVCVMVW